MRARRLATRLALMAVCVSVSQIACRSSVASDPAKAVERYLEAKVTRDAEVVRNLLCADLETQVETELTTFEGVNGVRIDGMACSRVGDESGDAVVRCQGKIVADYGAESNEFPLTTYRAKQENGVWKWCGEQAP